MSEAVAADQKKPRRSPMVAKLTEFAAAIVEAEDARRELKQRYGLTDKQIAHMALPYMPRRADRTTH